MQTLRERERERERVDVTGMTQQRRRKMNF